MAKELLFSVSIKDCRVEAIASTSGAGGQNKNRRHTAIRITHPPSGAVGYSADENNQLRNKADAFKRMATSKEFKQWLRIETARRITGKSIDQLVDEAMALENIKVEVQVDGRWVEGDTKTE